MQLKDPQTQEFYSAQVAVSSTKHLEAVTQEIKAMKCHAQSALPILKNIERQIDQSSWFIYGIAATILLTSEIGISNTLIISVLERTPEFGILKSLGARDSQIVGIMLSEGAFLGVLGAALAILFSLIVSLVAQYALRAYVERDAGAEMEGIAFHFSWQSPLLVVAVSVGICTLASILPAWRAARLDPVIAMRRT
jgi:putative ABC transport system permease protein